MSGQLMQQVTAVQNIPGKFLMNWPAFFGFAIVNYVGGMVFSLVPALGGTLGMLENALITSAADVLRMTTWEEVRVH